MSIHQITNPEREQLSQARIDEVTESYKKNQTTNAVPFENVNRQTVEQAIINFGFYTADSDPQIQHRNAVNKIETMQRYLASVSKVAIAYFGIKRLEQAEVSQVTANFNVIKELIGQKEENGRDIFRLTSNPSQYIHPSYLNALRSLHSYLENHPNIEHAPTKHHLNILQSVINQGYVRNSEQRALIIGMIKYLPPEAFAEIEFEIDIPELMYLTLGLSSNTTTALIKNETLKTYGDGFEAMKSDFNQLFPSFNPTESTANNYHWVQPDANTGEMQPFVDFMQDLMQQDNPTVLELKKGFQMGFGEHSFSESLLGKNLKSKGWKIFEKTGYYHTVNWVKSLADNGFPLHMTLSTVVTLVSPAGQFYTFGADLNIELKQPTKTITEPGSNNETLEFPDVGGHGGDPDYTKYYQSVFEIAKQIFRERLGQQIQKQILSES